MVQDALLQMEWMIFLQGFITLFAIFDPVGNIPIFLSITEGMAEWERRRVVAKSCLVAFGILMVFAYGGIYLFQLLNITLDDFRIVSGLILLIFAVEYVLGRGEKHYKSARPEEVAIFPLATPLLAGPGSISVVMLMRSPPFGPLTVFAVIVLNVLLAWLILRPGAYIHKYLGRQGSLVISRIMGLIIGAIAISFIRTGILGFIQAV
ncbi:MarC family protein [Candidatus Hecatella orcuttiae]|jgi:multiple antibiotic resistance protein|uniref:MarC family protein n=1 Tax=Candidatus Hecatella orcuttiae TaxID=1935119 RepID=UPI0028680B84|nr:MarC family protein [Candidatus Hecatella orcuttiae]